MAVHVNDLQSGEVAAEDTTQALIPFNEVNLLVCPDETFRLPDNTL